MDEGVAGLGDGITLEGSVDEAGLMILALYHNQT